MRTKDRLNEIQRKRENGPELSYREAQILIKEYRRIGEHFYQLAHDLEYKYEH